MNSDAFLPDSNHEERLANDSRRVLEYYIQYLNTYEQKKYVNRLLHFLNNKKETIFFRDEEMAIWDF